ncbi:MAG: serine hydrolase [Herpetosiphonaceae bacterium]|nr:serine hydrolase [Herpetosiphonaceae bacterium]
MRMRRLFPMLFLIAVLIPTYSTPVKAAGAARPLRQLSSTAANTANKRSGLVGAAVYRLDTDDLYSFQGNQQFTMYSIAKVPIMLAVLDRAVRQDRRVTYREQNLIEAMIEWSDNDATNVLYDSVGDAPGVQDFLSRNGIYNTSMDNNAWGNSVTTPQDMARLMARLSNCMMLVQRLCGYALQVMQDVDSSQSWGVTAGTGNSPVALKNGWYPDSEGWGINSMGIVMKGGHAYAIAVLTYPNPSMDYGISTVEQISTATYQAMQ